MPSPLNSNQFSSQSMGTPLHLSSMGGSVDSTVTSAGSTSMGNSLGNAVKATTGVSDFKSAGQSFSHGNILGGIGHSVMGAVNAASTAAMAVPGLGDVVKGADIGLNAAVKGADMFKAADAAKIADNTPKLYHGSGNLMKPGTVIKPGNEGVAFATPHRDIAATFANSNSGHTLNNQLQEGPSKWSQQSMFNPVYEVKPVNPSNTIHGYNSNPDYVASSSGFKVGKIHSWTSEGEKLAPSPSRLAEAERVRQMGSGI